ncbi:GNAT family N-acetyltransferase [Sedimentibacter sp. zth1]|uniref:GNAT family N-acetyltransferase n=1 Tax=Sedimentibacter sp. zth1 TaxID=2816908 RepID=UPI001A92FD60|nr:GNAT family N-acetyltransferase [Sedimentibacter sp. zth1]QSX06904.1 GNAT family N-acetyltransferase [Sedimentibacter sp. zth1]
MNLSIYENRIKHLGSVVLKTERLYLRKFSVDDAGKMFNNWAADEDVSKYTLWRPNKTVAETREYLRDWVDKYQFNEYYHWGIVVTETDELIGSISISSINNFLKTCNVGYTISKKYWNKGIATEALRKVLDYMVNIVGMEKIFAYHDVENKASGRVMQKCGMKYIKRKKKIFLNTLKTVIVCDYYCFYA